MRARWLAMAVLLLLAANLGWRVWQGDVGRLWTRMPTPAAEAAAADGALPETQPGMSPIGGPPPAAPSSDLSSGTGSSPPSPAAIPAPLPSGLVVPVQGVSAADLQDTFGDPRGDERAHEALDIMAPAGTPVLAVADGRIEKLFTSERGGLTIYQFEPSGTWCYYYAHLQAYAPGLAEGARVRRGEVIGFVGSTGNADPSAPHLHFAMFALTPEKQWWTGTAVNPYPPLTDADAH